MEGRIEINEKKKSRERKGHTIIFNKLSNVAISSGSLISHDFSTGIDRGKGERERGKWERKRKRGRGEGGKGKGERERGRGKGRAYYAF